MTASPDAASDACWRDALLAAAVFAVAPSLVGGVVVRAAPGPVRDCWLETVRDLLPAGAPLRRIPLHISESRLLGGLDLAATLRAGSPVAEQGLLATCHGGAALLSMAERVSPTTAALLSTALDTGEVIMQRDGMEGRAPASLGIVALDEGMTAEEAVSPALLDRLALHIDLQQLGLRDLTGESPGATTVECARHLLPRVSCPDAAQEALCATALALGIDSLRASVLAVRTARVAAALAGSTEVDAEALSIAVRLALAPRATQLPASPAEQEPNEAAADTPPQDREHTPPEQHDGDGGKDSGSRSQQPLAERLMEAAQAAIPPDLLARLSAGTGPRKSVASQGKSGAHQRQRLRGRPMGTITGDPRGGARMSLVATLRAAAPWQPLRRAEATADDRTSPGLLVRREDFRVTRFRQRSQSTTIFVVDASGSAALHRLAEVKGAIELLLADCYIRRDEVALVAFRGAGAELLLPPTRSLIRAKRSLAALPGGGGTPLASAIDVTIALVEQVRRRGGTPAYVMLTDGRANTCRDGSTGRQAADEEATAAARLLRAAEVRGMVIDTSPRPHQRAEALALNLGALYQPLPHADAVALRNAVQAGTT